MWTIARGRCVGLTKEQVLACMGPPAIRMAEGATEVWSYNSGDGRSASYYWNRRFSRKSLMFIRK
jgi:hypothetical protein